MKIQINKLNQRVFLLLIVIFCLLPIGPCAHAVIPLGNPAPDFTLPDVDRKPVTLSRFKGKPVVLFFFCGCKLCHKTAKAWATNLRIDPSLGAEANTVVVFAGTSVEAVTFEQKTGLDEKSTVTLLDPTANVSTLQYDADPCPSAFVLSSQQAVVYSNDHAQDPAHAMVAEKLVAKIKSVLENRASVNYATADSSDLIPVSSHLDPIDSAGTTIKVVQGYTQAIYNIGAIDHTQASSINHIFQLKNDGKSMVTIFGLQPTCSCTTASVNESSTLPFDVQPGQTVDITVNIDFTELEPGPLEKSVYVFGENGSSSLAYLEMDGTLK